MRTHGFFQEKEAGERLPQINTTTGFTPGADQSVAIAATSATRIINGAGGLAISCGNTGVGIGLDVGVIVKDTQASIGTAATVQADKNLSLQATSTEEVLSLAASAGVSKENGIGGALTVFALASDTQAVIEGLPEQETTVNVGGDVSLSASDTSDLSTLAFTVAAAGKTAVGAAGALNIVTNTVAAEISNSTVTAGGDVSLAATSSPIIRALGMGVSCAGDNAVSVSALGNDITDTVTALISEGSTVIAGGDVSLTAEDVAASILPTWMLPTEKQAELDALLADSPIDLEASILSVNISVAGSGKNAVSVGFIGNLITNTIKADISDSIVLAGVNATTLALENSDADISLSALSEAGITALSVGVGASGKVAFAATGFGNLITNTTEASITDSATVRSAGLIDLRAVDQSQISAVGLSIAASGSAAISAIVGANVITNTVDTLISSSTVSSGSTLGLLAQSNPDIFSFAGGVAFSISGESAAVAAGAALAINIITDTTTSSIIDAEVTSHGDIAVIAEENAAIRALTLAGAASGSTGGAAVAVGVALAYNMIANDLSASIIGSKVTSTTGGIEVHATENSRINAVSGAASLSVGLGSSGVAVSGAGAEATNVILSKTNAFVEDSVLVSAGDVDITARSLSAAPALNPLTAAIVGDAATFADNLDDAAAIEEDNTGTPLDERTQDITADNDFLTALSVMLTSQGIVNSGSLAVTLRTQGNEWSVTDRVTGSSYILTRDGDDFDLSMPSISSTVIAASASVASGVGVSLGVSFAANLIGWQLDLDDTAYNPDYTTADEPARLEKGDRVKIEDGVKAGYIYEYVGDSTDLYNYTSGDSTKTLNTGDLVKLDAGYGEDDPDDTIKGVGTTIYRYLGDTADIDLGAQDYTDTDLWQSVGSSRLTAQDYGNADLWKQVNLVDAPSEVRAYTLDSSITTHGGLNITADASQSIEALVISGAMAASGGSTGVAVSGAGAGAVNTIATDVRASIDGDGATGIETGTVTLQASDTSSIRAITGAASLAAGFGGTGVAVAIGVAAAHNGISNEVTASIVNADVTAATGAITVSAVESAAITSLTTAASLSVGIGGTGVAVSGAGAAATNSIQNKTNALVKDSILTTTTAAGDVIIHAADTSTIDATVAALAASVAGGSVGVGVAIGAAYAGNTIGYDLLLEKDPAQVRASVEGSTLTAGGDVELTANAEETITSRILAGSVAIAAGGVGVAVGGSGVLAINMVATDINAFISDSSTVTGDSVVVTADDASRIMAYGGAAAITGGFGGVGVAVSIGVALAHNEIDNTVAAFIRDSQVTATGATGGIGVHSVEHSQINAVSAAAALAVGIGGVGVSVSGAGAEASNVILTTTNAFVEDSVLVSGAGVDVTAESLSATSALNSLTAAMVGGAEVFAAKMDDASSTDVDNEETTGVGNDENENDINADQAFLAELSALLNDQSIVNSGQLAVTLRTEGEQWSVTDRVTGSSYVITREGNDFTVTMPTIGATVIAASAAVAGGAVGVGVSIGVAFATNVIGWAPDSTTPSTFTTADAPASLVQGDTVKVEAGVHAGNVYQYLGATQTAEPGATVDLKTQDYGNTDLWKQVNLVESPVEVQAYLENTSVNAVGALSQTAISDQSIEALVVAGSAAASGGAVGVSVSGAGAGAVNTIATEVKAFIDGDGATGITAGSVALKAEDTSAISAVTGAASLAAAFGAVGVGVSIGVAGAFNEISNDVAASLCNADTGVKTLDGGAVTIEAIEAATISSLTSAASLAVSVGAVGVAVSGAGAAATNIILNTAEASVLDSTIDSSGDVVLNASDTSTINAVVATTTAAIAGGAVGVGVSIGGALATNLIGTAAERTGVQAFVGNSTIDALGTLAVTATAEETIKAAVLAGSVAIAPGGVGVAVSGTGVLAVNTINTDIKACIDNNALIDAGSVALTADDTSLIMANAGAASVAASLGGVGVAVSIGVALAHNEINNEVAASVSESTVTTTTGGIGVTAAEHSRIEAVSAAASLGVALGAVGVSISGAGAEATNIILTRTNAFVADSTLDSANAVALDASDASTINATIATSSAALAGGGVGVGVSIGASVARNLIGHTLADVRTPAQVRAYVSNSTIIADGALTQTATAHETINATVLAGSAALSAGLVGVAVSGSGVVAVNKIATEVKTFVNGSTVDAGSAVMSANDTSQITADAGAAAVAASFGAVGVALSIGAAVAENQISNEIESSISNSAHFTTTVGDLSLIATENATITAQTAAAAVSAAVGAYSVAISGAGAEATNVILTHTNAYVEGSALDSAGDVRLKATDTSTINATVLSAAASLGGGIVGLSGSIGASVARNRIGWTADLIPTKEPAQVQAYVKNSSIQADGDLIQTATANETINATVLAGSVAVSAGVVAEAASGAGAATENSVETQVKAFIENTTGTGVDVTGDITLNAHDTSTISTVVGAASMAASIGVIGNSVSVGLSVARNRISNEVEAYVNAATVTSTSGSLTIQALEDATINATSVAASAAESASIFSYSVSGGGASAINTIQNSTKASVTQSTLELSDALTIESRDTSNSSAIVDTLSASSGILSFSSSGSLASATITSTIDAFADSSNIDAGGAIRVSATANTKAQQVEARGVNAGSLAVGASSATATVSPIVTAYVGGTGKTITAGSLTISSQADTAADAQANASAGGLIAVNGAEAHTTVTPTITAFIGDNAQIDLAGTLNLTSTSKGKATATGEGIAVGLVGLGASLADAVLSPTLSTSIGTGATITAHDITLQSRHNTNADGSIINQGAEAYVNVAGGGIVSGQGAGGLATASALVDTAVKSGAVLSALGDISISTLSNNQADALADGSSYGLAAAAVVLASATVDGTTHAHQDGVILAGNNLTVAAESRDVATALSKASSGGIVSGNGSVATTLSSPDVQATLGGNATLSNNVTVTARSLNQSLANASGGSLGAVTVGTSSSSATSSPDILAAVTAASVQADGDIRIASSQNDDGCTALTSTSNASTGKYFSLLADTGTQAIAVLDAQVHTEVAALSHLTAGGNVGISSTSKDLVDVRSVGKSGGVLAYGATRALVTITADTLTDIGDDAVIMASGKGDITSDALIKTSVWVDGGAGRSLTSTISDFFNDLISGNIGDFFTNFDTPSLNAAGVSYAAMTLNAASNTDIGQRTTLQFGGDLTIDAASKVDIAATARMMSGGAAGPYALAVTDIFIDSDAEVTIADGTQVSADNLTLSSDNQIDVNPYSGQEKLADANAEADLVAAYSTAISRVTVGTAADKSMARVMVGDNVSLIVANMLTATAMNHSAPVNGINGTLQSLARAKADTGLFLATASASAEGNIYADAKVQIGTNSASTTLVRAHDVDLRSKSDLTLARGPEAAAAGFITHVDKVISYVTDAIKKYLPWPFSYIVDAISWVVREVVSWFTWFEFSDANTNTAGTTINNNTIEMFGSAYIGYGNSQKLIINADGSVDPVSTIGVVIDDDKARVADIENIALGTLSFWTPGGTINGNATIFLNNGAGGVLLENFSDKDLVIGVVDLLNDNSNDPQISTVGTDNSTFIIEAGSVASDLEILNHSSADIILTGLIDNRPGTTTLCNDGGNIAVEGAATLIQTKDLDLSSAGDIGATGARLQVELYQRNEDHPEFWIQAGNNVFADIKGMLYQETGTDVSFKAYAKDLSINGIADLSFIDGGTQTFDVSANTEITLTLKPNTLAVDLEPTTAGSTGYSLAGNIFTPTVDLTFDPATADDTTPFVVPASGTTLTFTADHTFANGEAVVYDNAGQTNISGLIDDGRYYAVVINGQSIRLARSAAEAGGATFTGSAINDAINTINLGYAHGFATGETVTITGATPIPGLRAGATYYVKAVSATSVQLARSAEEADGATFTSGWYQDADHGAAGAVDATTDTINLGYAHGFITGDTVVYESGDATAAIGGLTSGTTYTVVTTGDTTLKLKDAAGNLIDLSLPTTNGATHSIRLDINTTGLTGTDTFALGLAYNLASAAGTTQGIVSTDSLTIADHGFVTGEAVVYSANGNTALGSLVDGTTYYVKVIDTDTIQLAATRANAMATVPLVLDVDPTRATGTGHSFSSATTIDLGYTNYYKTGQAVVYNNGGHTSIGGLTNGTTYYVVTVADNSQLIQLAATQADALADKVITVNTHTALGQAGQSFGLSFDPTATAVVDGSNDRIDFGYNHGLQTGQAVVYVNSSGSSENVGDLVSGTTYYAAVINATTIKLAATPENAAAMLTTVKVVFEKADRGEGSALPHITVSDTTVGTLTSTTVTLTLNTNASNPTTAQDLINAIKASAEASALIQADLNGLGTMDVSGKYFGDTLSLSAVSELTQSGSYTFKDLTLTGTQAQPGTFVIEQGTGSGQLQITGNTNTIELTGELDYAEGSVAINTDGDITGSGASQLIHAGDISLISNNGSVGTANASINIQHDHGELDAFAATGIFINAEAGDIRVGEITSMHEVVLTAEGSIINGAHDATGDKVTGTDLTLSATNGDIGAVDSALAIDSTALTATAGSSISLDETSGDLNLNQVTAAAGDIHLAAEGSILDNRHDADVTLTGNSITLVSRTGAIGAADDDLEVNSSFGVDGLLNATAAQNIYLTEMIGVMHAGRLTSTAGDIRLTVPETAAADDDLVLAETGRMQAAGEVMLRAGDDIEILGNIDATHIGIQGDYNSTDSTGTTIDIQGTLTAATVSISGGAEDDAIGVAHLVAESATISTGDGNDSIFLGRTTSSSAGVGQLSGIDALLTVDGGPHSTGDSLILDNSGSSEATSGTITATTVTGFGLQQTLSYREIENLGVSLGNGDNTINIQSAPAGTTTQVLSGSGDDTLNVSSDAPDNLGNLDGILGEVHFNAGGGSNTVNVSDRGNDVGRTGVVIDAHSISGLGGADGTGSVTFETSGTFGGGLNFWFGSGNDEVLVTGAEPDAITTLRMGEGADRIEIRDESPGAEGLVIAFGEGGADEIDAAAWNADLILFGDDGTVSYNGEEKSPAALAAVETLPDTENAADILAGGSGNDTLSGNGGNDLLVGDYGRADFTLGSPSLVQTLLPDSGGSDILDGGSGNDVLIGGAAGDSLFGGAGNDVLIGDGGRVTYVNGALRQAETIAFLSGGDDRLDGGSGNDVMFGGYGHDTFYGSFSEDVMVGQYARVTFNGDKVASLVSLGPGPIDLIARMQFGLYTSTWHTPSVSDINLPQWPENGTEAGVDEPVAGNQALPLLKNRLSHHGTPPAPHQRPHVPDTEEPGKKTERKPLVPDKEPSAPLGEDKTDGNQTVPLEPGPSQQPEQIPAPDAEGTQPATETPPQPTTGNAEGLQAFVAGFAGWGIASSQKKSNAEKRLDLSNTIGQASCWRWDHGKLKKEDSSPALNKVNSFMQPPDISIKKGISKHLF